MSRFNSTFHSFLKEANFTKQLLGAGATEIRRANYAEKGYYFKAFTSLSTGMERIGKLCLILDYYIEKEGCFPDINYLKRDIGHNLERLQGKAVEVVTKRDFNATPPNTPIHQEIVRILSRFAEGDRYSNINMLVSSQSQSDPISDWFCKVDIPLFRSKVKMNKKRQIEENARLTDRVMGHMCYVMHKSENGADISDVEEASYRTGVYEAVAPYRQLYVMQIIRFWSKLIRELQNSAMSVGKDDIPFFGEIFGPFESDDSYIRKRKTWDRV